MRGVVWDGWLTFCLRISTCCSSRLLRSCTISLRLEMRKVATRATKRSERYMTTATAAILYFVHVHAYPSSTYLLPTPLIAL